MIKKFELDLSSKITAWGMELFRIRALISFGDVKNPWKTGLKNL